MDKSCSNSLGGVFELLSCFFIHRPALFINSIFNLLKWLIYFYIYEHTQECIEKLFVPIQFLNSQFRIDRLGDINVQNNTDRMIRTEGSSWIVWVLSKMEFKSISQIPIRLYHPIYSLLMIIFKNWIYFIARQTSKY